MLRKVWEVEATILTLNPFPTKGGGLFFACFAYLNLLQSRAQDLYHNKEIEGGGHRDLPPRLFWVNQTSVEIGLTLIYMLSMGVE